MLKPNDTSQVDDQLPHEAVPTSNYNYTELADIYSRAREDYIVPMPMNAKRMEQYIVAYDVNLDASIVAIDKDDGEPNGVGMLGIRNERTWVTRLGVIPVRRRRRAGQFLMEALIDESVKRDKSLVQLEVIKGNEPAHKLFRKMGFEVTRELLIIRRAPRKLSDEQKLGDDIIIEKIDDDVVFDKLQKREDGAAWTEETSSLRNAGSMTGLTVTHPDGESGWVVLQKTAFQLSHFVLEPNVSEAITRSLIAAVHQTFPLMDTKIENVPTEHYTWRYFQEFGYVESFSRIEMFLHLK